MGAVYTTGKKQSGIPSSTSALNGFPQPGNRDKQLFPVFGDGAPGNGISLLFQDYRKLFVGKRTALVLGSNTIGEDLLDFAGGNLFSLFILNGFGEKAL